MSAPFCLFLAVISLLWAFPGIAAESNSDTGKKELDQACQLCHSLRLVESQRLSTAAWQKEMDKMIGWGAVVPDKEALVNYLSEHYSNTVPPPARVMSSSKPK